MNPWDMPPHMLKHENRVKSQGFFFVVGIDEAGRGPLAGPVVAAAVSLRSDKFENKIGDSKKLTALQRERAFHEIHENAYIGVGIMNESIIDEVNILQATYLAMQSAVENLLRRLPSQILSVHHPEQAVHLLIDGDRFKSRLPYKYTTIIGGDGQCLSIACASIIAKVIRDRILNIYHRVFPHYGFDQHKGYPTLEHKQAIQRHGLSRIHRKTFHHLLEGR
ncbi:MAG: ribonuclease HII [Candidatus Omnitrophica bacterium]|nr:ribonuclease HII [Candidatus Omnitrophota bacterium]